MSAADPSNGIKEILSRIRSHPWVGEGLLVNEIIPKLFGIDTTQDLGIWMEYAGSMMTPLSIRNEAGEEVFLAPPPLNNIVQIRVKRPEPGEAPFLSNVSSRIVQKKEILPAMGETYLRQQLSYTLDRLDAQELDEDKNTSTWRDILTHYGFITDDGSQPHTGGATGAAPSGSTTGRSSVVLSDEDELL